ncbi:MAG TPA: DUF401 family protein [Pseudothermotoga sp.]|nr:DUF401 family protein [Pseudothermotoga sp.]HOK84128.1 DUF401 family protein [Pseudothermotoga sp.]HPP69127.1 DUF401 family protein [Pseudothermotoga sp.]
MTTLSVLVSLASVIVFQRLTKRLIISMIAGFAVFSLINQQVIHQFTKVFLAAIGDNSFITLLPSIFLIYFLGELMSICGDAAHFSTSVQRLFQDTKSAAVLMPAVIGLMPMPAGAMFTAPIVDQIGVGMSNLQKTAVNYWFRHCLEFFWPVYPAMYLLSSLTNTPLGTISLRLLPLFLVSFLTGWIYLNGFTLPRINRMSMQDWKKMWPILIILSTGFMILVFKLDGWLALLIASSFYAVLKMKFVPKALIQGLKKMDIVPILLVVFLYKHSMIDLGIGQKMNGELSQAGLSVLVISIIVPLVIGMSTGLTSAAVGVYLPVLLGIGANKLAVVAYIFSVIGVLLSPVHLCLVLTCEYFKVDFTAVLKRIFVPIVVVSVAAILLYSW